MAELKGLGTTKIGRALPFSLNSRRYRVFSRLETDMSAALVSVLGGPWAEPSLAAQLSPRLVLTIWKMLGLSEGSGEGQEERE